MRATAATAAPSTDALVASLKATLSDRLAPVVVSVPRGAPLSASARHHRFGHLRVTVLEGGPLRLTRTSRSAAAEPVGAVALVLPSRGVTRLVQGGRSASPGPGEPALVDLDQAFTLEQEEDARVLLHRLPAHALHVRADALRSVTGRALSTARGVPALLAPLLLRLDGSAGHVPHGTGERLGGVVTEFVAALIDEAAGDEGAYGGEAYERDAPAVERTRLVLSVRRYVDRHLEDPELCPERIAKEHGISVRYLHRLFEAEPVTVGRLIQQRRVDRCSEELLRRRRVGASVSAVALRWGFRSPAHFSRAFKAVYGRTPQQWRAALDATADGTAPR
ncbi:helix-turn-helix domain-containing protein [Streptomyces sp. NPDC047821]|uniref:helix-turn-helix domain-containing protein n=1 Tax=Streptomyces sp. NPDC047821 TaxID=3365488 RepID=UPI00371F8826